MSDTPKLSDKPNLAAYRQQLMRLERDSERLKDLERENAELRRNAAVLESDDDYDWGPIYELWEEVIGEEAFRAEIDGDEGLSTPMQMANRIMREIDALRARLEALEPVAVSERLPEYERDILAWREGKPYPIVCRSYMVAHQDLRRVNGYTHWAYLPRIDNTPPEEAP